MRPYPPGMLKHRDAGRTRPGRSVVMMLTGAVTVAAAIALSIVPADADAGPGLGSSYRVTGVSDGDTVKVMVKGRVERVRLIGIDTPELGRAGAADQCHAREATRRMSRLVTGRRVHLQRDRTQADRDAYGRLLRYVYTGEGSDRRDVGRALVANGHGREYTFKGRVYRHRSAHLKAQRSAQKAGRGLWGECAAPTAPTAPAPGPTLPAPVAPEGCLIKGNIASDGERIYHVPGQQNYEETRIDTARGERWFCTETDAVAAGWRRAAR